MFLSMNCNFVAVQVVVELSLWLVAPFAVFDFLQFRNQSLPQSRSVLPIPTHHYDRISNDRGAQNARGVVF
jgi:hypothetical protein